MSEQELRELDIEVAEKVFGIAPREVRPRASAEVVKVWTTNPAILCDGAWEACELKRHGDPPRYSTDIAAAWLVVEKLKMTVKPSVLQVEEARWLADVRGVCDDDRPWRGYGPTAPIAICLAALAAVAS
ncbi:MAG TPA: hypothetical protein VM529_11245 [Gemmata sp.]|nr:hypothetical protein [Gemmata sp.]